jgi:hypothetical protein
MKSRKNKYASFWFNSKFKINNFARNPVKGGTPAIENSDIDNKNKEDEFRLNPESRFNVLLE